jgi:hypothetical protein
MVETSFCRTPGDGEADEQIKWQRGAWDDSVVRNVAVHAGEDGLRHPAFLTKRTQKIQSSSMIGASLMTGVAGTAKKSPERPPKENR